MLRNLRESNILDLIFSSDINMVTDVEVLDHLGNSDHNIIVWNLVCNVGKSKMQYSTKLITSIKDINI